MALSAKELAIKTAKQLAKMQLEKEYKNIRATVKRYATRTANLGFERRVEIPNVPTTITKGSVAHLKKIYNELHKEREQQIFKLKDEALKETMERIAEIENLANEYVVGERLGGVGFDNNIGASAGSSVFKEWAKDMLQISIDTAKRKIKNAIARINTPKEMETFLNSFIERLDDSWNDLEEMIENIILALYKAHKRKTAYWNYDKETYHYQGQTQIMALIDAIENILTVGI